MKTDQSKIKNRTRRHKRIRAKIFGTSKRPRLSVFKSNKHISAQIIDDENGVTLVSVHSRTVSGKNMMEKSALVGEALAKSALAKKIKQIVFDRGGFIYAGNIKALAEGARSGGMEF